MQFGLKIVYGWAGKTRQVNVSKGGFTFAVAAHVDRMMELFEHEQLIRYSPCLFTETDEIAQALAEVHVELMLIHPFREGNGWLGRMLATIMALQADLPLLDFTPITEGSREEYFVAVRNGMGRNYAPMKNLFLKIIEASI